MKKYIFHPITIFVAWAFCLSFLFFIFGENSYVNPHDSGDYAIPAKMLSGELARAGESAYWIPHWATGLDYWASGVSTQLDRLLYGLLPAWLAYGLFMFVQRLLAGLFTFYLLFQYLKFDKISAILACASSSKCRPSALLGSIYCDISTNSQPSLIATAW